MGEVVRIGSKIIINLSKLRMPCSSYCVMLMFGGAVGEI